MTGHSRFTNFQPVRRDRLIQEREYDAYRSRGKLSEPAVCPVCGAVFHEGRWQWLPRPAAEAYEEMCPACHRIHDEYPAGYVTLTGQFLNQHREELLHLVRNEEQRAMEEHPLKRIMAIQDGDSGILITTTDIHLARGIGEALKHAYQGTLEYHYSQGEHLVRVRWEH